MELLNPEHIVCRLFSSLVRHSSERYTFTLYNSDLIATLSDLHKVNVYLIFVKKDPKKLTSRCSSKKLSRNYEDLKLMGKDWRRINKYLFLLDKKHSNTELFLTGITRYRRIF